MSADLSTRAGIWVGELDVDVTLVELLDSAAEKWPDRVFLRMDGEDTSFAVFRNDVARLAGGLARLGVGPETRLCVFMRNSAACVQTWFAANWRGAAWIPINTEWRGQTLANALALAEPTMLVVDDELNEHVEAALALVPEALSGLRVYRAGVRKTPKGVTADLTPLFASADDLPEPAAQHSTDIAGMLYTSGTTGRSKACLLSHRYFASQAAIAIRDFGLRSDDVLYCPFPLFHADATALTTIPALMLGATAAIGRRFSASRFWSEVRDTGATVFDFMGATLSILFKADPTPQDADNSVRLAWGVPVPDWAHEFEERFGLQVLELYGSVEANIPITQRYDAPRVVGSCGVVVPECEVRLADEHGDPVPVGEVGELLVRSRIPGMVLDGYFRDPEATAQAFGGLWFHSGDLMRANGEGHLFFVGRGKDAIRRRGENISALEVEEGVESHPDVLEAAAIGVPSELTEEEVKVYLVRRPGSGVDARSIWKHCEATMARFQVPRYITFVDELPKTPTGKIRKPELRATDNSPEVVYDREAQPGDA